LGIAGAELLWYNVSYNSSTATGQQKLATYCML